MISLFLSFISYVSEIVFWFYRLVGAFWSGALAVLVLYFTGGMDFVLFLFCDAIVAFLGLVDEFVVARQISLPVPGDAFVFAAEVLAIANYYFPLDVGSLLLVAYVSLATTVWTIRFAIGLVPTIG